LSLYLIISALLSLTHWRSSFEDLWARPTVEDAEQRDVLSVERPTPVGDPHDVQRTGGSSAGAPAAIR
jgi:hypothetical protein